MPAVQIPKGRLCGVDALRGIAAVAVLLYHLTLRPAPLVPLGFAGVEVFFCISGFILAYAYEDALDSGLGALDYAAQRFVRLYPVYALGLAFGFAVYGLDAALNGAANPPLDAAAALAKSLLLLPTLHPFTVGAGVYAEHDPLFPYDNPAWSLLIEAVCSAVFFVWRPRGRALIATLAATGTVFVACALATRCVGGPTQSTFWSGYPRGLFCFYGGLALYRLWRGGAFAALPRSAYAALALLAIGATLKLSLLAYMAVVFVGAPLLVVLATAEPRSAGVRRGFVWLGDVSYPLYLLHAPLFALARTLAIWEGWPASEPWPRWAALAMVPAAIALSALVARYYDAPARRWLKARLAGRAGGAQAHAPRAFPLTIGKT
jgi:peptidoglycan/LPS O-acetylase OafA/YrhL